MVSCQIDFFYQSDNLINPKSPNDLQLPSVW